MTWTAETVNGETWYRAETVRYGKPLALVVCPVPASWVAGGVKDDVWIPGGRLHEEAGGKRWEARCGLGSTIQVGHRGSLLTVEPTAERAKACAAGWAEGV